MRNDMPLPREPRRTVLTQEWQQYFIDMRAERDRAHALLFGVSVGCGTLGAAIGGVVGYLIGAG